MSETISCSLHSLSLSTFFKFFSLFFPRLSVWSAAIGSAAHSSIEKKRTTDQLARGKSQSFFYFFFFLPGRAHTRCRAERRGEKVGGRKKKSSSGRVERPRPPDRRSTADSRRLGGFTHLLCMEFVGPWCMEGPPSFLFMPGGGHMVDPTWGCMPPMLEAMAGP